MKKTILIATVGLASAAPATASPCPAGAAVSVLYAGTWYPAKIIRGPDAAGNCQVSYDGFGANWDEWVGAKRMRPAAPTANAPSPAAGRPAAGGAVPAGKYACYTFDAGQLNYAYTDIRIESGNRYSVGGKSGAYALADDGKLAFDGPMANARGRFSVKSGGKPQIDLVFDDDARASMACPKT